MEPPSDDVPFRARSRSALCGSSPDSVQPTSTTGTRLAATETQRSPVWRSSQEGPIMKPMRPSRSPRALALLRTITALTASLTLLLPTFALADTNGPLPQGYRDDSLPQLPPAADTQNLTDEADAPETLVDDGYADTDPSALTDFREPLAPYGAWVSDPTYGVVWIPDAAMVGADFAPYQTAGHWALTADDEWIWVSDYDWGYVPFHYGRWVWIGGTGWAWIPGRVYAPAWVVWRVSDVGYIGWAPMPPTYYWVDGFAVSLWAVPPAAFVFCSTSYVFHTHVHSYVVHDHQTVHYAAHHSHVYRAAQPTHSHAAPPAKSYKPATPSLGEAKIPKIATPTERVPVHPKALALANPKSGASGKAPRSSRGADVRPASPSPRAASRAQGALPSPRAQGSRAIPMPAPEARPRQPVLRTPRAPKITPPTRITPAPRAPVTVPRAPVTTPRAPTPQVPVVQAPKAVPHAPAVAPRAPTVAPRVPVKSAPKIVVPKRRK